MIRRSIALFGFVAAACASAPVVPDAAAILPGEMAAELLRQCSRDAPPPGESTWQPTWSDIARFEAALPRALAADPESLGIVDFHPTGAWVRQYVGLVRGGRRFIYGNFAPRFRAGSGIPAMDPSRPIMICDGGPVFFGAEYDVEARRVTHLAFNGAI